MIFKDLFASIKKSKIENQKPIRKEKSSESVHLLDSIETINEEADDSDNSDNSDNSYNS